LDQTLASDGWFMSAQTAAPPQPHLSDEEPVAQYRSISPTAIGAVALGLASALILTTPLLALIPVAAIVVAIVALRGIAASEGQLAGRSVAITGLCLATLFLGIGLTRHLARQRLLEKRAREMSDVFFDLLEKGNLQAAHQFRQSPTLRITSPDAIAEHYASNQEAAKDLQTFGTSPGIKDIVALGKQADVRFEGVWSATRDGMNDTGVLSYSCQKSGGKPDERQPLWVHIYRKYDESTKRNEWEIGGVQNTAPLGATQD